MAETDLSPSEFTQRFVAALSATQTEIRAVIRSDLELALTNPDGSEWTAYLDNAYRTYVSDPPMLEDVIETYILSLLAVDDERPVDHSLIVPIIKDRAWLQDITQGVKQIRDYVVDDFIGELVIVYAEDGPANIRYLRAEDLTFVAVPRERLREFAVGNLERLLPPVEMHTDPLVWMVTAGGAYEASLLLFDEIWSSGQIKVDGEIVVAVPARDLLMVTGSNNAAGLAKVRELAAKWAKEAPYRLTDTLFVYRDGRFTPFRPN